MIKDDKMRKQYVKLIWLLINVYIFNNSVPKLMNQKLTEVKKKYQIQQPEWDFSTPISIIGGIAKQRLSKVTENLNSTFKLDFSDLKYHLWNIPLKSSTIYIPFKCKRNIFQIDYMLCQKFIKFKRIETIQPLQT